MNSEDDVSSADGPRQSGAIRVVHLVLSLSIGGLETIVVSLAGRASRAVEPHVLCLESLGPLADRLQAMGVPVECVGAPGGSVLRSVARIRRRIGELSPDVLHCHNEKAHIHGALATLGRSRPALVHTRHGRSRATGLWARTASRLAVRRSRFTVSVSADARDLSLADGARPERVRVIRNGIDVAAYDASTSSAAVRTARAVSVGRLAPIKDVDTLVRAARLVRDERADFALDIVGGGPSRNDLMALCRELGLQEVVSFHGPCEDPRPFLSKADVFVQSSLSEGLSLTLLEAMAAGLPIVATEVGGNREVVEPGRTGLLVPPRDPPALARALLRLLDNPSEALAMSRAARARVEREFDVARMVAGYEALYFEAVRACSA